MRIMTINIWGDYFQNPVDIRQDGIHRTIQHYDPAIVGLQEMTAGWYQSDLLKTLTDYRAIAFGGNFVPLLYKTAQFDLVECGYEPYTDTPDQSKGITWAVLTEKGTGRRLGVCNTHLWWRSGEEHDRLRLQNARQLLNKMRELEQKYTINTLAFGDFNSSEGSLAFNYLEENNVHSSYKLADTVSPVCSWHGNPVLGEDGRYHGQKTAYPKEKSIDHIIATRGAWHILTQHVVEDQAMLDASDHSPVYIDIE